MSEFGEGSTKGIALATGTEKWVSIQEVTNWIGADPAWVQKFVSSGKISSKTERGTVLIDPRGLSRLLRGRHDSIDLFPEELKTLEDIGEVLGLRENPELLCRLILEPICASFESTGGIVLVEVEGGSKSVAWHGLSSPTDKAVIEDMGAWAARTGETLVLDDPLWDQVDRKSLTRLRSCVAVPLRTNGVSLGAIVLVRPPNVSFTDREVAMATILATETTLAIERSIIQAALDARAVEADSAQRQMEAYASDLRGTFIAEKERSSQLAEALLELEQTYLATVRGLAVAVEAKDAYTAGHIVRVTRYGLMMMDLIAPDEARDPQYEYGFLLHDVGKLAVPDAVLGKTGSLTEEEWAVIRLHPETGRRILEGIPFLALAKEIVYAHHERWDGKGYPLGLNGEEIRLGARVFPIADSFDAMTSDRPYRKAMSTHDALAEIRHGSGTQFWPEAVEAFLSVSLDSLEEVRHGPTTWDPLPRD